MEKKEFISVCTCRVQSKRNFKQLLISRPLSGSLACCEAQFQDLLLGNGATTSDNYMETVLHQVCTQAKPNIHNPSLRLSTQEPTGVSVTINANQHRLHTN